MADALARRFPIRFDDWYRVLSRLVFLPPRSSYLEIAGVEVRVRMSWGFRAAFPRSAVRAVSRFPGKPLSRGAHGWGGRWLVNGSGQGILAIDLDPVQRAWVAGFPVRLRQLLVSLEDPAGAAEALRGA